MTRPPISVLIVDDSALMRSLVGRIMESDPRTSVAGKAMNGVFALRKIETLHPEVIILDLEMPEMNGIEFLRERKKRGIDVPVIVLSSIAKRGAQVTMEALALGASDFVLKPSGSVSSDIHVVADHLLELVASLGAAYRQRHGAPADGHKDVPGDSAPEAVRISDDLVARVAPGDPYAPAPPVVQRPRIAAGPI
ncbi:MAG: response regulator, partial [Spirochaetales bacterium]